MNNRQVIDRLLCVLGLTEFFDVVVTVDEVSKTKPDPEIFLKAAEKLGVKPTDCVVVEDSIFGVKAAKAADMGCVAVTQGAYKADELAQANPDLIVNSLSQQAAIERFILG
jgi:beta-phosphoglucomutase-like phosphatase (HAD superfamily)